MALIHLQARSYDKMISTSSLQDGEEEPINDAFGDFTLVNRER